VNKRTARQVTTLPARTVIAETQSERNVEPSFSRTETDVVVECTIQRKNIHSTGVFFLIREFETTPSFQNAKIGGKKLVLYSGKYELFTPCKLIFKYLKMSLHGMKSWELLEQLEVSAISWNKIGHKLHPKTDTAIKQFYYEDTIIQVHACN
jgi:hypothetical protein